MREAIRLNDSHYAPTVPGYPYGPPIDSYALLRWIQERKDEIFSRNGVSTEGFQDEGNLYETLSPKMKAMIEALDLVSHHVTMMHHASARCLVPSFAAAWSEHESQMQGSEA